MKLTYIYHSGFAIESDKIIVIIDFFKDTEARKKGMVYDHLLKSEKRIYVLSSHVHPDHFNREVLDWREIHPYIRYIFSEDILQAGKAGKEDACFLKQGEGYEDEYIKIRAYGSTDIGISFLIRLEEKIIFHAGDLNNWHWKDEIPEEEARRYENAFLKKVELLTADYKELDLLLFPIDPRLGREYMLGAQQILDRIRVAVFSPMHFGQNYAEAASFRTYAESKNVRFIEWTHKGQSINF
ncbi:MAG: MBL fold metallo-hydrolase [Candidatus Azobacteroides sp.]|nr:MBL fold metallo-hydrolase [Candidatus Azobacteroides sp.]